MEVLLYEALAKEEKLENIFFQYATYQYVLPTVHSQNINKCRVWRLELWSFNTSLLMYS